MRRILVWMAATIFLSFVSDGLAFRSAAADTLPMTDRQMVHESEHVVVAVVDGIESRWNPQHTLIFTDYALRIEDRLKGTAPQRVTLSVPGGTLDGETHATSLSTPLVQGARYLLFLADLSRPTLEPVVGAQQGAFREIVRADGKRYAAVVPGTEPLQVKGRPVEFQELVESVRALVEKVSAHPEPADDPVKARNGAPMPSKRYASPESIEKGRSSAAPAQSPAAVPPPPWTAWNETGFVAAPPAGTADRAGGGLQGSFEDYYVYQYRPPGPIIFDNFPASFSFSPYDQYQMGYWNVYAKNLFRVYTTPSGTWRFGNGVFDLAGFPGNDQMLTQFGAAWGATTLGITYYRVQNNVIVEADIALNPAFSWTVDDKVATQPTGAYSFKHAMLHELGHSWGLKHPWETQNVWWDSVMNYSPKPYHFARLLSDDTSAVRAAYPGTSIRDGALSSYITQDSTTSNNANYIPSYPSPSTVRPGGSFTVVNPIKLENAGTVNLVNPTIEVYLTPQRLSFTNAIFLRSLRYSTTVKPRYTVYLNVGTLSVPGNLPAGTYFLGYFYRDAKDGYQGNNSAWGVTYASSRVQDSPAADGDVIVIP
jgi:hypothetical protein